MRVCDISVCEVFETCFVVCGVFVCLMCLFVVCVVCIRVSVVYLT